MRILVLRGPDKEIIVYIRTKEISEETKLGIATSEGHFPSKGAEV